MLEGNLLYNFACRLLAPLHQLTKLVRAAAPHKEHLGGGIPPQRKVDHVGWPSGWSSSHGRSWPVITMTGGVVISDGQCFQVYKKLVDPPRSPDFP